MSDQLPDRDSPLFNRSLEKGIAILQSFGAKRRTMTLAELADAAQISRASAQRSVHTLQAMGLIHKQPSTRRFQLAPKVMSVGCNYLEADALIDAANPFLAKLSSSCNETTNLTEPDGLEMVYVARFPSHKHIPIHVPIGRHMPMYCTSAGRAFLSGLPDAEVRAMLKASDRRQHTPHTCTDPVKLLELIRQARARGFAFNNQEYYLGDVNVAAPVLNSRGRAVAAIHVSAPTSRWQLAEAMKRLGPMVIDYARAISNAARALD
jgi:DNA-binding IclR family transcriptional regulator